MSQIQSVINCLRHLEDLKKQATLERSHHYVEAVATDAIALLYKFLGTMGDVPPASPHEDQIRRMVSRFLAWPLPDDFAPDCGISFEPVVNKHTSLEHRYEPVGTNLFTAVQAEAMIRHIIE